MSDLSSLPVAPEFAGVLSETAIDTALEYLKALHVPDVAIDLVRNIYELGYYQKECYANPTGLLVERKDRFDIETVLIETINCVIECGGTFKGPWMDSQPREPIKPVKVRK